MPKLLIQSVKCSPVSNSWIYHYVHAHVHVPADILEYMYVIYVCNIHECVVIYMYVNTDLKLDLPPSGSFSSSSICLTDMWFILCTIQRCWVHTKGRPLHCFAKCVRLHNVHMKIQLWWGQKIKSAIPGQRLFHQQGISITCLAHYPCTYTYMYISQRDRMEEWI